MALVPRRRPSLDLGIRTESIRPRSMANLGHLPVAGEWRRSGRQWGWDWATLDSLLDSFPCAAARCAVSCVERTDRPRTIRRIAVASWVSMGRLWMWVALTVLCERGSRSL